MACFLLASSGTAFGAESKTPKSSRHGADCQLCYEGASGLELSMPVWVPLVGIEGVDRGDNGAQEVSADPQLEFALVAEVRLRFGPVGVALSAYGASLGTQIVRSGTGEALGNVDLDAYFGHATIDWYTPPYRVGLGRRPPLFAIWPYMGARYIVFSGHGTSPDQALLFEGTKTWAEPIFGMRFMLDLRRGWLFDLSSDLGGFSVGSKVSLRSSAGIQYAVTDWLNFRAGWVIFYARFQSDEWDGELLMQGPGLGFGIPLF